MLGSEVLDAAAIGAMAALLGGIISGIFSLLNNKMATETKKVEISFAKQVDAFREMNQAISSLAEKSAHLYNHFDENPHPRYLIQNTSIFMIEYNKIQNELVSIFHKNRLYFPKRIDKMIDAYIELSKDVDLDFTDAADIQLQQKLDHLITNADLIADEMQKIVSLERH